MVKHLGLHQASRFKKYSMCKDSHHCMFADIVFRLALRYQLRYHGAKLTPEEAQVIENKQGHLQKLIDKFQHQADTFILHQHGLDHPKISPLDDYDQFDDVDSSLGLDEEEGAPSRHRTTPRNFRWFRDGPYQLLCSDQAFVLA